MKRSPSSSTRLSCLTSEAERGERASEQAAPPRPPGLDLAHRGLGCRALICASSQLYSGRDGSAPSLVQDRALRPVIEEDERAPADPVLANLLLAASV